MKVLKGALIAAGVGAVMAVLSAAPASAETLVNFTWNPGAVNGVGGTSQQFTANGFGVADYAAIDFNSPTPPPGGVPYNNVVEHAVLQLNSLDTLSGSTSGFIGGPGSLGNGSTDYKLYFVVTATSTLTAGGACGAALCGNFTSFNYTLYEDVGGKATFAPNALAATVDINYHGDANQIVLATGQLDTSAPNSVSINSSGVPGAAAYATINSTNSSFWIDPTTFMAIDFTSSFINNTIQTTQGTDASGNAVTLLGVNTPGGGSVNLVGVPEPITLSLFGAGLVGGAFVRRRKSKKA